VSRESSYWNPTSELWALHAIRDHTVLPATQHNRTHPIEPQPDRLVLDLPIPKGWKAELT